MEPGGWINIKMPSYQYRKFHCGDKTILRPSYLHNGICYTGKTTPLYWIGALVPVSILRYLIRIGNPTVVHIFTVDLFSYLQLTSCLSHTQCFPIHTCKQLYHMSPSMLTMTWHDSKKVSIPHAHQYFLGVECVPCGFFDMPTLVQVMAWCRQATSHYLMWCWWMPNGVTGQQSYKTMLIWFEVYYLTSWFHPQNFTKFQVMEIPLHYIHISTLTYSLIYNWYHAMDITNCLPIHTWRQFYHILPHAPINTDNGMAW